MTPPSDPTGLVVPNGKKIAQLRKQKKLAQKIFLEKAGICERSLRDVERKNKPLSEPVLCNIATVLGVTPDELRSSNLPAIVPQSENIDTKSQEPSPYRLLIRQVTSGNQLWQYAENAQRMIYDNKAEPTPTVAILMEEILNILKRGVAVRNDGYDDYDESFQFPSLHRVARLNELITELNIAKIAVLGGTYIFENSLENSCGKKQLEYQTHLCVSFYPSGTLNKLV